MDIEKMSSIDIDQDNVKSISDKCHQLNELQSQLKEKEEGKRVGRERFVQIFYEMSIQRNLKAVGTFAYQSVKKNNHKYEDFIAPTLGYVRKALRRRFKDASLQKVLSKHIPGLNRKEELEL